MSLTENALRKLPDIAKEASPFVAGTLEWVGMGEIEVPISLTDKAGHTVQSGARVTAYINLNKPEARGIHMSRLYLHVDSVLSSEPLTPGLLRRLLREFLDSHSDMSDRAMVRIQFDYLVRRAALMSDNSGWKSYPIAITGVMNNGQFCMEIATEVLYSSTCPCSAALARQLIQERFAVDFAAGKPVDYEQMMTWLGSEQGICATPHSQRSSAEVRVKLVPSFGFPIIEIIDAVENALQTPVQAAVKRVDEQAFAKLNGANLMFCEDAARRIQSTLNQDERITDFWIRASHYESLHPHNAVAIATKGVVNGFQAGSESFGHLKHG